MSRFGFVTREPTPPVKIETNLDMRPCPCCEHPLQYHIPRVLLAPGLTGHYCGVRGCQCAESPEPRTDPHSDADHVSEAVSDPPQEQERLQPAMRFYCEDCNCPCVRHKPIKYLSKDIKSGSYPASSYKCSMCGDMCARYAVEIRQSPEPETDPRSDLSNPESRKQPLAQDHPRFNTDPLKRLVKSNYFDPYLKDVIRFVIEIAEYLNDRA